ncbi:cytochrome C oxidase subunit IV family protein [Botrimarina hoheduenensis]|uniref:Cytochrome C oxidase subunit IV n=1 Tax=Botrimarina hoheduenensis TaxID=2528000 RepID=A0A5C5W9R1_9BACT|nr:cytochrome C oxidase subunit IV family protein [Botrimarina hoheduenensis]TWT46761.1 hypothetical protein Pla111_18620 [Botrimarina hoheduenensis]
MSAHAHHEHHVSSPQLLVTTFLALVALTVLTVAVSQYVHLNGVQVPFVDAPQDLRWLDIPITLVIATIKALLVAVIFMHLQHDKLFNSVVLAGSVIFLVLFVGMVLLDSNEYQPDIKSYLEQKAVLANP